MDATTLPSSFQTALAIFEALRRLGFESDNIFFTYGPTGMHVMVKHDGREWSIRAGSCDMDYSQWKIAWPKVARDVADGTVTQESLDKICNRFAPYRMKLVSDLLQGGIRIPHPTAFE